MFHVRYREIIALIVIIISLTFFVSGCLSNADTRQTTYHDNVSELEQFVLSELGDYIAFQEPHIGTSYSVEENRTIDDEIDWQIVYLRQYYYDDERTTKVPPGEVIARFRELYNSFMTSHPDYYLSDYNVVIYFNIPLKQKNDMPPFRESGFLTTYDFESWNNKYTQLTGVSLDDDLWPYMYGRSGIETAAMTDNSYDQIIEVADNIPQLKKIIVHDQQMVDRVSDMRPNVNFVSAAE